MVDKGYEVGIPTIRELNFNFGLGNQLDRNQLQIVESKLSNPISKNAGGSSLNTVIAVSQLGGKCFFSGIVGDDDDGKFFVKELSEYNHNLETNITSSVGATARCLVLVTPNGERTFGLHIGVSNGLSYTQVIETELADSAFLFIEGYLVTNTTSKNAVVRALRIARENKVQTALSLSDAHIVNENREDFLDVIGDGVDILFANEREATAMSRTTNLKETLDYFRTIAKSFIITRGSDGSLVYDGTKLIQIDPIETIPVDTVGAGDMYAGCFLYGINNGLTYTKAGELASKASAQVVSKFGSRLNTRDLRTIKSTV